MNPPIKKRAVIFALSFLCLMPSLAGAAPELIVEKVIDGKSVKLSDGRLVRLIGVDVPHRTDQTKNRQSAEKLGLRPDHYSKFAERAADFLAGLIKGKRLRTEVDPAHRVMAHHDGAQRFLAYLYADDVLVNAEQIKQGFGHVDSKFPFRFKSRFLEFEKEAKAHQKGLWS